MTTHDSSPSMLYLIDDGLLNEAIYEELLPKEALQVLRFSSPSEFLELHSIQRPACIVCDLSVGAEAVELLQLALHQRALYLPLIMVGVDPPLALAVRVMERGALTVMCQPVQVDSLRGYVEAGLAVDASQCKFDDLYALVKKSIEQMTPRQQMVLSHIGRGLSTKQIALELAVSERLVEKERSRILELFCATSTSDVTLKLGGYNVIDALKVRFDGPDLNFFRVSVRRSGVSAADRNLL